MSWLRFPHHLGIRPHHKKKPQQFSHDTNRNFNYKESDPKWWIFLWWSIYPLDCKRLRKHEDPIDLISRVLGTNWRRPERQGRHTHLGTSPTEPLMRLAGHGPTAATGRGCQHGTEIHSVVAHWRHAVHGRSATRHVLHCIYTKCGCRRRIVGRMVWRSGWRFRIAPGIIKRHIYYKTVMYGKLLFC